MKKLIVFILLASCTGCAGLGSYMKDRGNDFLDCFKLQAGWGVIADAEVRVTDYISTGAGLAFGMKWGLEGRYPVGFGDIEGLDMHIGLPFTPFIWLLESSEWSSTSTPFKNRGWLNYLCTDYNIRYGAWMSGCRGPEGPVHEGYYWNHLSCRQSHKGILLFDMTCLPRYRDLEDRTKVKDEMGCPRPVNLRKSINAFDIEVGATLGLSARVGFSPGQFVDFLLGWFTLDIGDDDDLERKLKLIRAIDKCDREAVKELLAAGIDINTCVFETTPLHQATTNRELAELLIKHGAKVNIRNSSGQTPLHWTHTREVGKLLIENGASVNARDNESKTPLHSAHTEMVKLLIDNGAEVDAMDMYGSTPLYLAACGYKDDVELMKALVDAGADLNAKTLYGWVPLHEACRLGYAETVKILVSNAAETDIRTKDGQTPLHLAVSYTMRKKEIVESLIAAGADMNAKDNEGKTPLDNVYDDEKLKQLLRKHGAKSGSELEHTGK